MSFTIDIRVYKINVMIFALYFFIEIVLYKSGILHLCTAIPVDHLVFVNACCGDLPSHVPSIYMLELATVNPMI